MKATHETITRYRYSTDEIHGHVSYVDALGFAQSRLEVNEVGSVSVTINRLVPHSAYPDRTHHRWIETLGGLRHTNTGETK